MSTLQKQELYDALADFIQREQNRFYLFAYSYVKTRDTALDMVQTAVLKALSSSDSLKNAAYLKTWFYRILINVCLNELRKSKMIMPTDPNELPEGFIPQHTDPAELMDLQHALEQLSPNARNIITLRYFEDMKISDIAETLGENVSTVKTKLYRTLEKLKLQLEGEVF